MFAGDWQLGRAALRKSVTILQERCYGRAYETDLAWNAIFVCDKHLGDFADIRQHLFHWLDEAKARGDQYLLTVLLTDAAPAFFLRDDNPEEARRLIQKGLAGWNREVYDILRHTANISLSEADIYAGDGISALQRTLLTLPKLRPTFLLRLNMARHQIYFLQGRAALSAIAQAGVTSERMRWAEDAARRLEKEADAWFRPFADLIRAGQSALRGDHADAITRWQRAADSFSRSNMLPYAAAARWRVGQSAGGEKGNRLRDEAIQQIQKLGVRNPARFAALLAPGPKDTHLALN